MRFLHCSDIHLGRRPVGKVGEFSRKRFDDYFAAFDRIIDIAIEHAVDAFLISGDMFDRRELGPEVLERSVDLLQRLKDKSIPVIVVEGNHDNVTFGQEHDSWLTFLENRKLIVRPSYTLDEQGYTFTPYLLDGIAFYGIGYPGAMVNETLTELAQHLKSESRECVVLVHTAPAGTDILPGTVDYAVLDLFEGRVLYMAGGHFHAARTYPEKQPFFFIPGSSEYWDLGERGRKGCLIFDTLTRTHTFHSSDPRRLLRFTVDITATSESEARKQLLSAVDDLDITQGEDIVLGECMMQSSVYLEPAWLEEQLMQRGALKSQIRIRYPGEEERKSVHAAMAAVEEIEEEVIRRWEFFGRHASDIVTAMDKLKGYQRERNQQLFFEQYDRLIESLMSDKEEADADQ